MLEVQLNLMEKDGNINILSSPSITTLDNKMAYTENAKRSLCFHKQHGDREVKFEDAVLRLEMTPNVIDGDNLKLKVLVKKDEVDTSRSVDGNPFIIKKQTETTLIMRNGETVVISGLTKEKGRTSTRRSRLKDIPGGKYVFGHESKARRWRSAYLHHAGNPAHAGTAAAPVRAFHERKPFAPERGASRALGRAARR